jgi:HEAT repeat protein
MKETLRSRIVALRPLLKDPVSEVRTAAAGAIEKLEALSTVDEILAALKTGNMGARIGAIYALGEIGGEKVLPPLVYCARRSEVDIRSAAASVLGKLALQTSMTVLEELLDDKNPTVQGHAIAALHNFQVTPEIFIKLRMFLDSGDGVREAEAAHTLAVLKDLSSYNKICALLASPHASTRQAAATALSIMPLQ